MNGPHRRTFLKNIGLGAAAWTAGGTTVGAESNERVVVGVIGPGGMGSSHIRLLAARADVEIASLCDVDQQRLAKAVAMVESATGKKPDAFRDLRRLLENDRIDAVFIATPDHWHAPAAILALDAGKHVYVEKPCCHNIREGRLMVEAVRRSGKCCRWERRAAAPIVSARRSSASRRGKSARCWWPRPGTASGDRRSVRPNRASRPNTLISISGSVPRPWLAYRSNMLPSIWRWWYDYGCRRHGQRRRARHRRGPVGIGRHHASLESDLPGGKILFRRRSAVSRHPIRHLRVWRRSPVETADL